MFRLQKFIFRSNWNCVCNCVKFRIGSSLLQFDKIQFALSNILYIRKFFNVKISKRLLKISSVLLLYLFFYIKVKWSRYRPNMAQRVGRGIALLFHDRGTRRGWVASSTPRPHFTPGKDPVPIVQEAGWAPGPVWTGRKILSPPGFDPRTVQPVVSRYNDWATRPTIFSHIYI